MKIYGRKKELSFYQKVCFTFLILLIYRFLSHVPLPFVQTDYVKNMLSGDSSLGLWNMLTGGNFETMSIMALGITPYITASIVLQLLGVVFPALANMQKEGSTGQKKMKRLTIGLGVVLGFIQGAGMMYMYGMQGLLSDVNAITIMIPAVIMTIGVFILSYAGQFISDHLFGNGISLLLITGILCSYGKDGLNLYQTITFGKTMSMKIFAISIAFLVVVLLFGFTIWLTYCEKKIPVLYSGKANALQGGAQVNVIPLKLVGGSVVPIIFASTVISMPSMIASLFQYDADWLQIFNMSSWLNMKHPWNSIGLVFYMLMILGFSYYYQALNLNEWELAQNLKKYGGMIQGVRPGNDTAIYLKHEMKYLTLMGGFGLCIVAFVPVLVTALTGLGRLSFLGTSILIVVSVIMETIQKWNAEKQVRYYKTSKAFMNGKG